MDMPLLQTKLYTPLSRSNLVARPHLIERLNEGLDRKLTLVSAPAGFGKTTLVAEWLGQTAIPVAWLSLDKDDGDLTRFLTYFVAALQQIEEKVGQTTQRLLQAPQPPPPETLMTSLINDIAVLLQDFALVLDDYHLIEAQPVHEAVTYLLNHMPPHMHLVITTRADPPLPLPRLRARGQMTGLGAHDLRFSTIETAAFLDDVVRLKLSAEAVAKLESRTEGWVAGLQMAALSMQRHDDQERFINAFTGHDQYVVDYLIEEVLSQQPAEIHYFLLQTAILNRLCGPLCDAVLDRGPGVQGGKGESSSPLPPCSPTPPLVSPRLPVSGQDILEYLDQANLFIVSLDNERRWYRYHHLFADLLQNRLQRTQPDLIPALHRRASAWYEGYGWIGEAISHAVSAEEYDRAASLIGQNRRDMLKRGQVLTLENWLNKLPSDIVQADPHLCVASAWVRLLAGPLEAFEPTLQQAEQTVSNSPARESPHRPALVAEVQAIRAIASVEQGDTSPEMMHPARQALDDLPADDSYLTGTLTTALALAYHANGDTEAAIRSFTTAKSIAEQSNDIFSILHAGYELATLQVEHGQLHQAEALHRQALTLVERHFGPEARHIPLAGAAHVGLGKLLYEWNDLQKARQHLQQGFDLSNQAGGMGIPRQASMALAWLCQALGDGQAATAWMQRAEEMAHTAPRAQVMKQVLLQKARLQLAQGQVTPARRWAQQSQVDISRLPDYSDEMGYLTLVRIALAQEDQALLTTAIKVTGQLLARAEAQQRWDRVLESLILQALSYQALSQTDQALQALQTALTVAEAEGYIRRFVDEGQRMIDLLETATIRNLSLAYVSRLLASGKSMPNRPQPLVEPLTGRELEILNLIAAGLSNKEIAEALFIAVGTVKRHTMNIYGKLDVNSRTQAAVKGRQLRLIE